MPYRGLTAAATATARVQYVVNGRDLYTTTLIEREGNAVVVTVCTVSGLICQSRRISNPDIIAFVRWHMDTVADLTRREGA